jgi:xylulose-5-phosphate/fructose-6-phosphate phosphoketolase
VTFGPAGPPAGARQGIGQPTTVEDVPPDTNTLLSVADHCLRSRDYINVIVAGKQPGPSWLDGEAAALHCARGLGIWDWASTNADDPDAVLACAGDVPTIEMLAAADLLHQHLPDLRVRFVNVVDLMRLHSASEHPHGLPDVEYDALFTTDRPVIFAYHGYPWLIHRLTYRRTGHANLHVRGYKEEGTTTTPFDMVVDREALTAQDLRPCPAAPPRLTMKEDSSGGMRWPRNSNIRTSSASR